VLRFCFHRGGLGWDWPVRHLLILRYRTTDPDPRDDYLFLSRAALMTARASIARLAAARLANLAVVLILWVWRRVGIHYADPNRCVREDRADHPDRRARLLATWKRAPDLKVKRVLWEDRFPADTQNLKVFYR
jgi:hypothetical protein